MNPEDPDSDPNHSQNIIASSFYHFRHILKILSKSIHKFLNYLVHKQSDIRTDRQTDPGENITSLAEVTIPIKQDQIVILNVRVVQSFGGEAKSIKCNDCKLIS